MSDFFDTLRSAHQTGALHSDAPPSCIAATHANADDPFAAAGRELRQAELDVELAVMRLERATRAFELESHRRRRVVVSR